MKKKVFVPAVLPYPCDNLPNSLHIAAVHFSRITGSFANFSYFVIVSPVSGWTTALTVGSQCSNCMEAFFNARGINAGACKFSMVLSNILLTAACEIPSGVLIVAMSAGAGVAAFNCSAFSRRYCAMVLRGRAVGVTVISTLGAACTLGAVSSKIAGRGVFWRVLQLWIRGCCRSRSGFVASMELDGSGTLRANVGLPSAASVVSLKISTNWRRAEVCFGMRSIGACLFLFCIA
eukprot:scaffold175677_cov42-Cyclotella_meneghiniana.AAC.4